MLPLSLKEIAQHAMSYALKVGASAVRVSVVAAQNNSFEYLNTRLDKLHRSSENKIYAELFVDGRYGVVSTNRIDRKEIEKLLDDGVVSTRFLSPDAYRQLPPASRYYRPTGIDLDLCDPSFDRLSAAQKIELAKQTVEEIYRTDERIISVNSSYDDCYSSEYMLVSNGFEAEVEDTAFSLSASVSLRTSGDARPEADWYDSAVYWSDLQKTGIAQKALELALGKIGQKKIRSGQYNMLLDNTVSKRLLSPVVSALYGSALQQNNSFLLNKIGKQIASAKLSVFDCPHLPRNFGAALFDGEGVATRDRAIIENGVLQTYYIDTYNSLKMQVEPTIAAPSIVAVQLGGQNRQELMKSMGCGIWVTGLNGGNSNPTTGDFSYGIEGFRIENGEATQPVGGMNITGNLLSLWLQLEEIGNDTRRVASWRVPSLLFSGVNFSGE
ncbi:MAG: TldD/PmbA family protein [Prevotella sp.]|jgi:PmbA protein|nr:TldD/PmbA family protein [Prevotella sp.]